MRWEGMGRERKSGGGTAGGGTWDVMRKKERKKPGWMVCFLSEFAVLMSFRPATTRDFGFISNCVCIAVIWCGIGGKKGRGRIGGRSEDQGDQEVRRSEDRETRRR